MRWSRSMRRWRPTASSSASPTALQLEDPLQIIHVAVASQASAFTRSHVRIGNGARATLIESFVAAGAARGYQVHDAVVVSVGDKAELTHVRLMADAPDAVNITSDIITIGAKSKLNLFNMTRGGAVSRFQGFIKMAGEGSELSVNGVNLLKGTQHGDTTLVVDHAVPHCTSREIFRAVLDDRAHSVFQGRIIVRPDAQKTDGKMMTRALLLSDEAEADNKPELEIFADDVTCGHGATSGALDDSLLFYLRARGLPEKEAQALLIQAFVGEAIEQIGNDELARICELSGAALAGGAGMTMHPAVSNGSLRRRPRARGFSGAGAQGLWQAAGLSRQRRLGAKAERGARAHDAGLYERIRQRASRPALSRQCRDRSLSRAAATSVAKFLNARRNEEIVFTRNATEAINLVASSWGEPNIKAGDEIVLSIMEHHSNIVPWHFLRERHGAVIKWADVDDDGNFLIEEFEKLLSPRTKLVAITQMSNALGTIVPVKDVVKHRACPRHSGAGRRQPGRGSHGHRRAGHRLRLLCLHRPQALWADRHRRALRQVRSPRGDAALQWWRRDDPRGHPRCRHLWRSAAQVRGRHAADRRGGRAWCRDRLRQFDRQGRASPRMSMICSAMPRTRLRDINSLRLIGTASGKGPMISFEMKGAHAHDVATVIDRQGIAVRAGTHCVMPLLERFNVTATCRASFAMYNTREEVDHLVQALIKARELFA